MYLTLQRFASESKHENHVTNRKYFDGKTKKQQPQQITLISSDRLACGCKRSSRFGCECC
jgi:hypothetical protein